MAREVNGKPIRTRGGSNYQQRSADRYSPRKKSTTAVLQESGPMYTCYDVEENKSLYVAQHLGIFGKKEYTTEDLKRRQLDSKDKRSKGLPFNLRQRNAGLTWNESAHKWEQKTELAGVDLHPQTRLVETTDVKAVHTYDPTNLLIKSRNPFGERTIKRQSSRGHIRIDEDTRLPGSTPEPGRDLDDRNE